jgi:hypothetical protein
MNDPHAKAILNTAALHLGVEVAEARRQPPIAEESVKQGSQSRRRHAGCKPNVAAKT